MSIRHPQLGQVTRAGRVVTDGLDDRRMRNTIWLLAGCVALMMTGYGIIIPVFARRLGEFGGGVKELGLMIVAFALAQFVAAPVLGSFADRRGRRPAILLALVAFLLANIGFLLARSSLGMITVRALEGGLTAGLFPAAMGVVADVVPRDQRGRWTGIVMGGYGAGFVLGPVFGGFLYDGWGFAAPFIASAVVAGLALSAAFFMIPETRTAVLRRREALEQRREQERTSGPRESLWASLPRPLPIFATLLAIDFVLVFGFAFVEPEMVFYLYDDLGWSTVQFGLVITMYGSMIVLGQGVLGQMSDRLGRKPVIVIGLLLHATFYIGLALFSSFWVVMAVALVSGIGEALVMPAQSAFYMDISSERHRSRVMGFKESAAALGGVVGPLLVILLSEHTTSRTVFLISFGLLLAIAGVAFLVLREPSRIRAGIKPGAVPDGGSREDAAQQALQGIVDSAAVTRGDGRSQN